MCIVSSDFTDQCDDINTAEQEILLQMWWRQDGLEGGGQKAMAEPSKQTLYQKRKPFRKKVILLFPSENEG